jgi:hypothetical protein
VSARLRRRRCGRLAPRCQRQEARLLPPLPAATCPGLRRDVQGPAVSPPASAPAQWRLKLWLPATPMPACGACRRRAPACHPGAMGSCSTASAAAASAASETVRQAGTPATDCVAGAARSSTGCGGGPRQVPPPPSPCTHPAPRLAAWVRQGGVDPVQPLAPPRGGEHLHGGGGAGVGAGVSGRAAGPPAPGPLPPPRRPLPSCAAVAGRWCQGPQLVAAAGSRPGAPGSHAPGTSSRLTSGTGDRRAAQSPRSRPGRHRPAARCTATAPSRWACRRARGCCRAGRRWGTRTGALRARRGGQAGI